MLGCAEKMRRLLAVIEWVAAAAIHFTATALLGHYLYLVHIKKEINFGFGFEALAAIIVCAAAVIVWLIARLLNADRGPSWMLLLLGFAYMTAALAFLNAAIAI